MVIRAKQLDALAKSVTYSQALLANGFANYTEVLTAQQNLLTAQLNGISDQQRLQAAPWAGAGSKAALLLLHTFFPSCPQPFDSHLTTTFSFYP